MSAASSALALQGVRYNLGGREPLVLWGDDGSSWLGQLSAGDNR